MQETYSRMLNLDRHAQPAGLHLELELELELDGARKQDIARGLQAAQEVFQQADVSSYAAAVAVFYQEMEGYDLDELTAEQYDWAELWRVAEEAAVQAACRNLPAGRKSFLFSRDWDDSQLKPSSADVIRGSIDWPGP